MEDRYKATMLLHALGDTIGFKNGDWEFNYRNPKMDLRMVLELAFEFIELGGVNAIDLKGWRISDDTIFHIAMAYAVIEHKGDFSRDEYIRIKNLLIDAHNMISDDEDVGNSRYIGITTQKSITAFTDDYDARFAPFDSQSGGNGCAMRNVCIGLVLCGEKNRKKLIDFSINTSMLTHNHPYGFLGGLTSALFGAYAIENIPIVNWPFELMSVLNSEEVKKYINKDVDDIYFAYRNYIRFWDTYIETRFLDKKPLKMKANANLLYRAKYYYDNFTKDDGIDGLGVTGHCAMLMAYDALLDCDGAWEKLIFYAMLHPGDSDTVGSIAGGLYGAVYGFGDVPLKMLEHLEKKEELLEIGANMLKSVKDI